VKLRGKGSGTIANALGQKEKTPPVEKICQGEQSKGEVATRKKKVVNAMRPRKKGGFKRETRRNSQSRGLRGQASA